MPAGPLTQLEPQGWRSTAMPGCLPKLRRSLGGTQITLFVRSCPFLLDKLGDIVNYTQTWKSVQSPKTRYKAHGKQRIYQVPLAKTWIMKDNQGHTLQNVTIIEYTHNILTPLGHNIASTSHISLPHLGRTILEDASTSTKIQWG